MGKRFLSLWFRHLTTDYLSIRRPALLHQPFVLALPDHGRMVITAANPLAMKEGISTGMAVADARVLVPTLEVLDDEEGMTSKLLRQLAIWCIRYTPVVSIDAPDGLLLDISGCPHLWGGEKIYIHQIVHTLRSKGYDVRGAIADTVGAAWAIARYGRVTPIIAPGEHVNALFDLPPAALRIDPLIAGRLQKLGLDRIHRIAGMARQSLRTRFGNELLLRLDQAFGRTDEPMTSVAPVEVYIERLPCLEPICTAGGIEIALTRLLDMLCGRLQQEGKGLRTAVFKGYRVDGQVIQAAIGTHRATHNAAHLFKLFEEKISTLEPGLGIEVFTLEAPKVEDTGPSQKNIWEGAGGLLDKGLSELIDRVSNKMGPDRVHRYLPAEHYWPERAITETSSLDEIALDRWSVTRPRPVYMLARPEPIEVTAPIPDYPPMLFRHRGGLHKIIRADGPERIEQEWWIASGQHRDYYMVEDEGGVRYWIFRSGHYKGASPHQWFLHGYFA
ncbi:MAG TPA: DNA polymerase Y family protein [Puia sp.]